MEPRINLYTNRLAGKIVGHLLAANKIIEPYLPVLTRELVKIRSSQLNGCSYGLDMHTKDAAEAGDTAQRINLVASIAVVNAFNRVCVMTEQPSGHYQPRNGSRPTDTTALPA